MRYLWIEYKRTFFSGKFILGIIGVTFVQFFSVYQICGINTSVYNTYDILVCLVPFISCMIFCSIPYAQSFCEDFEYNYIQQILLRLNLKKYTLSRAFMIFLSANITMILGTVLFVCIIHFQVPWIDRFDSFDNDFIIKNIGEKYILYYIIRAFFSGLPASCMALLAAYISLFWQNKIFVLSIPFFLYSLMTFYINDIFAGVLYLNINKVFNPSYNMWNNEVYSLLWPIMISVLFMSIVSFLIYRKLRYKCYGKE